MLDKDSTSFSHYPARLLHWEETQVSGNNVEASAVLHPEPVWTPSLDYNFKNNYTIQSLLKREQTKNETKTLLTFFTCACHVNVWWGGHSQMLRVRGWTQQLISQSGSGLGLFRPWTRRTGRKCLILSQFWTAGLLHSVSCPSWRGFRVNAQTSLTLNCVQATETCIFLSGHFST